MMSSRFVSPGKAFSALAATSLFCLSSVAQAATYYVATNGDNNRTKAQATSYSTPWQTIQHAATQAVAGDTVIVKNGTYYGQVTIANSGTAGNWITFQAENFRGAVLDANGSNNGFFAQDKSYIKVRNFVVRNANGTTSRQGIHLVGGDYVNVEGNEVYNCGGNGIAVGYGDYFTVTGNTVYGNANTNKGHHSGITLIHLQRLNTNSGYHNVVTHNRVFNNAETWTTTATEKHSDGNGIIVDVSDTIAGSTPANSHPSVYIANNWVYGNGGRGIFALNSANITIVSNTCYQNGQDLTIGGGEIAAYGTGAANVRVFGNIMHARPDRPVTVNYDNAKPTYGYNLLFGGNTYGPGGGQTGNVEGKAPSFVNANLTYEANFHLNYNSPAINANTGTLSASNDWDNQTRPRGGAADMGADEY